MKNKEILEKSSNENEVSSENSNQPLILDPDRDDGQYPPRS